MNESSYYIYGRNPIIEALNSGADFEKIYLHYNAQGEGISRIIAKARKLKIPVVTYDKHKFEELERKACPRDARSQGIIGLRSILKLLDLDELINSALKMSKMPILIAADGITDPQNLGAIARAAECAGASGLIIPERDSAPITPAAIKASAGALEYLPVAKVNSLINAIDKCKQRGFWVAGTSDKAEKVYTTEIWDSALMIIIGSEGKGMSPAITKHCDHVVRIPMKGRVSSLNASVATGIILFEIIRQRQLINS